MKLFLDTADTNEISKVADLGLLDGVTTNPSIIASSKRKFKEVIKEICDITKGPVSAEVLSSTYSEMLNEAIDLAKIADNVVIKIPLIPDGIKCVSELTKRNIKTNVTLCFSAPQALLAAKAGATYISPFIGRLDDIAFNGLDLISEIRTIYDNYQFETKILAASIRHPIHFKEVALEGADAVTLPYATFQMLFKHPQTDLGLAKFLEDAKKIVQ
ncbi:MAG TPA: fructose-6-phosphate aldolase [Leptospiraceae bacterium]|nr:fructose-6-phosphate aldolase [Leptospiraceae bacterium]HMW04602.1 fructose-6-phosphate aldolase [Leptospiraceae bacterium]HMX34198.1 fructose-6-phosphate aldolase [Leptospiraceae bacterium]HMY30439.1 fructose-6-phosphate aldolase [Leptospiraceae bacterium]HMZ66406.1 fructose-6-phosphate aldolase [Leptospiraceae bacterium]